MGSFSGSGTEKVSGKISLILSVVAFPTEFLCAGNSADRFHHLMKFRLLACFAIIILAAIAVAVGVKWWTARNTPHRVISASGGEQMNLRLNTPKHYLQTDPRWAAETIGGSDELIRNVGCTICSAATVLTAIGPAITPQELNDQLKANDGYTADGWLIWGAITKSNSNAKVDVISQPSHAILDSALADGDFPLVKFWLPGGIPHWVVLVGKDGADYLALDPYFGDGEKKLSVLTNQIDSVRVIRKH